MSTSDAELLREYATARSEQAFAALVERHLDLVYSAARRQVRSSHLAEEVAQSVFIDLARNAGAIRAGTPLVAWLHVVSRRTAIDAIRRESRRQSREHEAAAIAAMKSTSPEWNGIEPLLDDAVESLNEADRAAILLRYFENKSLRDVGAALGTSEDTAQKRVSRAVEQLRGFFLRRGIAVSAAGLATDLSAHALQFAPAGLGATITSAATTTIPLLPAASTAVLTMTSLQKTLVTAAALAALGGVAFETHALRAQRANLATLHARTDDLASQIHRARLERDAARSRTEDALRPSAAPAAAPADVAMEAEMQAWLDRVARLKQLQRERPDLTNAELSLLPDDRWMTVARNVRFETEEQIRSAFAGLRNAAEGAFIGQFQRALRGYLDANQGVLPEKLSQVLPFFDPPVDSAVLAPYTLVAHGKLSDLPVQQRSLLVERRAPVDPLHDMHWKFGLNSLNVGPALGDHVRDAREAFSRANNGAKPTEPGQLRPYLAVPFDAARLQPYFDPPPRR